MNTDTKTALLDAAKRLVVERGYAGTTVRELAAASGTNLGAVNYHFGSREELLDQALLDAFVEWLERVGEMGPADPDAGPFEQLSTRARPMIDGIPEAQPAFVLGLEAMLQARRSPALKSQLAAHYAQLRQRICEYMTATTYGSERPPRTLEVAASWMLAIGDGLQLQALFDPEAIPTGEELAALYEGLAAAARAGVAGATGDDTL
jgi:AcrR family transcriptional regulator